MKRILLSILFAATFVGCIENDIPLPFIEPRIMSMEVEGATEVYINSEKRSVEITLAEQTDPSKVAIKAVEFDNDQTKTSWEIVGTHDLTQKLAVTLSIYQDYVWTISAKQPIERYFSVEGQIGASEIDDKNLRAVAYVTDKQEIINITVSSLKLGPADITTYSPSIDKLKDFTHGQEVTVTAHGKSQKWMLYVEQTATLVTMKSIDAWTGVAWLKATGVAELDNGFQYRKKGESEWIKVEKSKITSDGGAFSTCIEDLEPLTEYECYAFSGENKTDVETFTTEEARQMPNSGFEVFSKAESSKYYSFYDPASAIVENQTKWWGSGNKGSTTVGESHAITIPDNQEKKEGKHSVRLESQWVIMKFAAGNIFVGEFAGLVGTKGGMVNFGRPFTQRPRKLVVWLKYTSGVVDRIDAVPDNDKVELGDKDRAQVFIAVGDWDYRKFGGTPESPVQVNTTDRSTFFDPKSEGVIGYGAHTLYDSTDGWQRVEIPLEYVSTSRKPTHIIVSCASSMLGDYFTGSTESRLWVDAMELVY